MRGDRLVWKLECNIKFDVGSFYEVLRGFLLSGVSVAEHLVE